MLGGGSVADPPDDPVLIEAVPEFAQRGVELCDRAEAPQPEQLLRQGADEALDTPVALGLADERRARLEAEGLELVLEGVEEELAAVVMAQRHACGDADLVVAPGGPGRIAQVTGVGTYPLPSRRRLGLIDGSAPATSEYAGRSGARL